MKIYAVAPNLGQFDYAVEEPTCLLYAFDDLLELRGINEDLYTDYYKSLAVRLGVLATSPIYTTAVMPLSLPLILLARKMLDLDITVVIPSGNDKGYITNLVAEYGEGYYKNYFCPLIDAIIDNSSEYELIQLPVGCTFTDIIN